MPYIHTNTYVYIRMCTYIQIYTLVYVYIYINMYVYIYTCLHTPHDSSQQLSNKCTNTWKDWNIPIYTHKHRFQRQKSKKVRVQTYQYLIGLVSIYLNKYLYIYINIYINIYTHISLCICMRPQMAAAKKCLRKRTVLRRIIGCLKL